MFSDDYFDFYSNSWDIGETIGHDGGDPGVSARMYYKKKKGIGCIFMINTSEFPKIKEFEKSLLILENI